MDVALSILLTSIGVIITLLLALRSERVMNKVIEILNIHTKKIGRIEQISTKVQDEILSNKTPVKTLPSEPQ